MQITIPFTYQTSEIPPKCRKPRSVRKETSLTVSIAEILSAEAPVALIQRYKDYDDKEHERAYRWYGNCLWVIPQDRDGTPEIETAAEFLNEHRTLTCRSDFWRGLEENRKAIQDGADEILFIDGVRWEMSDEPEYHVCSSINWSSLDVAFGEKHEYGDNYYYRVDQLEEALAFIAHECRGEVEEGSYSTFEILMPEALRLPANPKMEKFYVTVTLQIEARGVEAAAREFVSDLGIERYRSKGLSYNVASLKTGKATMVKLPED